MERTNQNSATVLREGGKDMMYGYRAEGCGTRMEIRKSRRDIEMASYMNFHITRKRKRYEEPKDYTVNSNMSEDDIYNRYRFTRGKYELILLNYGYRI